MFRLVERDSSQHNHGIVIEDYALIGKLRVRGARLARGSIDWLCFPRFDSPAVSPPSSVHPTTAAGRCARSTSPPSRALIGATTLYWKPTREQTGRVRVTDAMIPAGETTLIASCATARCSADDMELAIRFDYVSIIPWVHATHSADSRQSPDRKAIRSAHHHAADRRRLKTSRSSM